MEFIHNSYGVLPGLIMQVPPKNGRPLELFIHAHTVCTPCENMLENNVYNSSMTPSNFHSPESVDAVATYGTFTAEWKL